MKIAGDRSVISGIIVSKPFIVRECDVWLLSLLLKGQNRSIHQTKGKERGSKDSAAPPPLSSPKMYVLDYVLHVLLMFGYCEN